MKRKRVGYIDLLRVVSAFAVVMIHVVSLSSTSCPTLPTGTKAVLEDIHNLLRWSVPVFCMITGFLFLGREKECTYRSIRRNVVHLLLLLVLVGGFYSLLEQIYTERRFSLAMLLRVASDLFTGNLWDHMWYLYMIIGVYLTLPVVAPFFRKEASEAGILCVLSFLLTILLPDVTKIAGIRTEFSFPIAGYSFYVFMGGFLGRIRYRRWQLAAAFAGIIAGGILMLSPLYERITVNYRSLPVAMMAVGVFVIAAICFEKYVSGRIMSILALCSGGIYLLHPLFLNLQIKALRINPLNYPAVLSVPLNCVIIFGISAVGVYLIKFIIKKIKMKGA